MNNRSNNRRDVAHGNVDYSAEFPTFPQAQQQILCCPLTCAYFSPKKEEIVGRKKPKETQHDFDVFQINENGLLIRNIWQIESEWAYTGENPKKPKPLRTNLIEDINKLICGCARNSLLITSVEWLKDDREWFMAVVNKAAFFWNYFNRVHAHFYLILMPFVSKWDSMEKQQVVSRAFKYEPEERRFEKFP